MSKSFFVKMLIVLLLAIFCAVYGLYSMSYDVKKEETILKNIQKTQLPQSIRIQPNVCPKEKREINIALITDSKYTIPTATSMYSAIKNKCPNSIYNFYIITENTTKDDDNFILSLKNIAKDSVNITLIPRAEPNLPFENMERFIRYKVGMHKIYLPEILNNINKVIYMDGDTIVLKDLNPLYDIDVNDVYASVARDGIYYRFIKEMKEMGLDKRGYYFNSGVMLYNLDLQRKENITDRLVNYVKTTDDFYGDQDALNVVFEDKLKAMSYRYNCIPTFFEEDDLNFLSKYHKEELPKEKFYIYENSTIIHYAGSKPWDNNFRPLYLKELWFKYYNEVMSI